MGRWGWVIIRFGFADGFQLLSLQLSKKPSEQLSEFDLIVLGLGRDGWVAGAPLLDNRYRTG